MSLVKKAVAEKAAVDYIRSNMVVGLGTGSTANYVIYVLNKLLQQKKLENITCVCTSKATEKLAREYNIPIVDIDEVKSIDVAIDGADEVDADLNLIKGRGGALFREKFVEQFAKLFIVIVDNSKIRTEGFLGPIPVEIVPFGYKSTAKLIQENVKQSEISKVLLRENQEDCSALVTDNGNYILDVFVSQPFNDIAQISESLKSIRGVVEHGLFPSMADICLVGKSETEIDVIESEKYKSTKAQ